MARAAPTALSGRLDVLRRTAAPAPTDVLRRLDALRKTRTGRALVAGLAASLGLLAGAVVVRHARVAAYRMPTYRIAPEAVQFIDLPREADERMRMDLSAQVAAMWPTPVSARPSIFDASIDRRLREILVGSPMIREVLDVEVRYPAEVRVRATLRTPLARFRAKWPNGKPGLLSTIVLPLDEDGVVLQPDTYARFLAEHRAVLVTGVEAMCPGLGHRWTDSKDQVVEGLAAARVANRLNAEMVGLGAPRVEMVDVANFPAMLRTRMKGEVVLVLNDGRVVQWGRTERDLVGVTHEDGYDVKRDRLLDLLATRSINDGRPLDVRFPTNQRDLGLRSEP
jgi:hypothetical protein